ncbi:MAG: MauE/DoxX family redox-associated membrane protein [Bacteroidota bacterium]
MTLSILLFRVGIAAVLLTLLVGFGLKKQRNWVMTFVQNYCGALFLFSGWVKAVDPLGTAYKMEQYFGEFESTFADTAMGFIAPMFPFFSEYSVSFSVFMIVFEILLGLMLIMGAKSKLTSWLFLGLVAFFTVLTGFTYLTGYVPQDVNFFEFGKWGVYNANNMKVTDCGCFGDFLKLEPKVSFFKDIALMVPAIYFVVRNQDMHEVLTNKIHNIILGVSTVGLLAYCFSNYVWDLPHEDFRPFKVAVDIRAEKEAQSDAMGSVQITDWILENKETGKQISLPNATYMSEFKNYPKSEWTIVDQKKTEPSIPINKISEFAIENFEGYEVTEELLNEVGYSVMMVCHKLYTNDDDSFDADYVSRFTDVTNEFTEAAEKAGWKVYGVAGGAGENKIEDFRHTAQTAYPFYVADDILLKTIVRSNPGIVVLKDGKIVNKWHYKQLPEFESVFGSTQELLGAKQ